MNNRNMIAAAALAIGSMGGIPASFGRVVEPATGSNGTPHKPASGTDKPTHDPYAVQMTAKNLKRQRKGLKPKH